MISYSMLFTLSFVVIIMIVATGQSVRTENLEENLMKKNPDNSIENPIDTQQSEGDVFKVIDEKALLAQNGQQESIGELVDKIVLNNGIIAIESSTISSLRDRIVRAEINGTKISEQQFMNTVNWLADELSAPTYAKTTPLQIRALRLGLNSHMPNLFVEKDTLENISVQPTQMSVCEAVSFLSIILQQKTFNSYFQKDPNQWDAEFNNMLKSGGQTLPDASAPTNIEMRQAIYGANLSPSEMEQLAHRTLDQLGLAR